MFCPPKWSDIHVYENISRNEHKHLFYLITTHLCNYYNSNKYSDQAERIVLFYVNNVPRSTIQALLIEVFTKW